MFEGLGVGEVGGGDWGGGERGGGGEGRVEVGGGAGEGAMKTRTILTTAIFAPILNTNSFFGSFSSVCIYFILTKEQYWRGKKWGRKQY